MSKVIWKFLRKLIYDQFWRLVQVLLSPSHSSSRSIFYRSFNIYVQYTINAKAFDRRRGQSVWHGNWHDNNWTHNNKALFFHSKTFWTGNFLAIFFFFDVVFCRCCCCCCCCHWTSSFMPFSYWCFNFCFVILLFCRWYITNFSNVYLILLEIRQKAFFIFLPRLRVQWR